MSSEPDVPQPDVVVVGAGFAGLYLIHRLTKAGFTVRAFEAADGLGGTWYWNRYPGARCDIPSIEYSYGFDEDLQQEWVWTERYSTQAEILAYLEHVADRFDLRRHVTFGTRVSGLRWSDETGRWTVGTDTGLEVTTRFVVMATGCLSAANTPAIPGLDSFAGPTYHTGKWPHSKVDFTGRRVGIIGTGSSGVQSIPIIAEQADHLYVFQRTPAYSVPAWNRPLDRAELDAAKARYASLRRANRQMMGGFGAGGRPQVGAALETPEEQFERELEERWEIGGLTFLGAFTDVLTDPKANQMVADFVRAKIREVVTDPVTAGVLTPTQIIGCKRLCADSGYYETFNRPNVTLVDLQSAPIEEITPAGLRTTVQDYEFDTLVLATGFDAMTGPLLRVDVVGRKGQTLREAWSAGPRTYLGLGVPDFPNLFVVTGPGSPSVLTNMVTAIEQHVEWISRCLEDLREGGVDTIEADRDSTDQWVEYVNTVAGLTLFPTCNSWYVGANIPGKTRVFMPLPGFPLYAEQTAGIAADGYRGFTLVPR